MSRDRGNAAVEFVAVVPLLFLVGLAVLQVALFAHAAAVVGAAAAEAARVAAVSADPARAARQVAVEVLDEAMGGVPLTGFEVRRETVSGLPVIAVEVRARPDLALLPVDPVISRSGRAIVEVQP